MRYPKRPHGRRGWSALVLLLAAAACGGGGALLPTEADTGGVPGQDGAGGDPIDPPVDPGDGGDGGGNDGGGGPVPVSVTVTVDDVGFHPATLAVTAGSTVTWTVLDGRHDVTFTGVSPAGGSIGETREGDSASRTFDAPGTYTYHCVRHADDGETGTVVVEAGGDGGGEGQDPPDPPTSTVTVSTPGNSFSPSTATIGAGGTVDWQISGDRHNVTFTGAAPPGGNIPDTDGQTVSRTFPVAGRFDYFCTRHSGMTGAVVVQ